MPMHLLKNLTKRNWNFSPTCGLHKVCKTIKKKNSISKFVKCKNKIMKEFNHNNYENYRNLLFTLLERDKENYLTKFLNESIIGIKKTWKGIKILVSMKQKNTPSLMTRDEKYINDPVSILLITFLPLLLKLFTQISNFKWIIQEFLVIRNQWFFLNKFCKQRRNLPNNIIFQ